MDYLAILSGLTAAERKERVPSLLAWVNLAEHRGKKVKALSGGMKRRLGIAQALLNNPRVLIVDEPTAGLDPEERVRFRNLLAELSQERIVLLSTHIVGDIEAACEDIVMIDEGRVLYNGTVENLLKTAQGRVFTLTAPGKDLPRLKKELPMIGMHKQGSKVQIRFVADTPVSGAEPCEANMEDAYMLYLRDHGVPGALAQKEAGGESSCCFGGK